MLCYVIKFWLKPVLFFKNRLEGAVKDNDFIYHEVVPDLSTVPEIKGWSGLQMSSHATKVTVKYMYLCIL
jgi:hypothetical protein